ncbi:hypothetical protein ACWELJ_25875 [Nocardia sp. NPDC004582]
MDSAPTPTETVKGYHPVTQADAAAIDAEIAYGVTLAFGPYLGWTGYSLPAFLRALAEEYPYGENREWIYLQMRRYADDALERANQQGEDATDAAGAV